MVDRDLNKIKEKINALRREIDDHNYRYHVLDQPLIDDYQFDRLMRELLELEEAYPELQTADSPTRRVGGEPLKAFATVEHRLPMLGLDNAFSKEELEGFDARLRRMSGQEELRIYHTDSYW